MGLLANNAAVVIGAMVVAPWILPLRTASVRHHDRGLEASAPSSLTLLMGAVITTALSMGLGLVATPTGC